MSGRSLLLFNINLANTLTISFWFYSCDIDTGLIHLILVVGHFLGYKLRVHLRNLERLGQDPNQKLSIANSWHEARYTRSMLCGSEQAQRPASVTYLLLINIIDRHMLRHLIRLFLGR